MFSKISRLHTQAMSLTAIGVGTFLLLFSNTPFLGVAAIGFSCWILMMSESMIHAKVQIEMHRVLDDISRKKEREVEEVLYFLRQSSIAASPFESIDGAKKLCKRMQSPAMVLSTTYQIIAANKDMHRVLGWKNDSLSSVPAYTINDVEVMSKIGEYAALPENVDKPFIATSYAYKCKSGNYILGQMNAYKIGLEGFFVTFFPDNDLIISRDKIKSMIENRKES